jgi:hypothetical protein
MVVCSYQTLYQQSHNPAIDYLAYSASQANGNSANTTREAGKKGVASQLLIPTSNIAQYNV